MMSADPSSVDSALNAFLDAPEGGLLEIPSELLPNGSTERRTGSHRKEGKEEKKKRHVVPTEEDLEVVELSDLPDCHTGLLTHLYSAAPSELLQTPQFDNYFVEAKDKEKEDSTDEDDVDPSMEWNPTPTGAWNTTAVESGRSVVVGGRVMPVPALEDFLAVEDGEEVDGAPPVNVAEAAAITAVNPTENTSNNNSNDSKNSSCGKSSVSSSSSSSIEKEEEEKVSAPHHDVASSPSSTSSLSSESSMVDLPGLTTTLLGEVKPVFLDPNAVFLSEEFKAVAAEVDDTVTAFSLDPTFDYTQDLLGKAYREHGWRETDIK